MLFCIDNNGVKIDFRDFTDQQELGEDLNLLNEISPILCFLLIERYIHDTCDNEQDIIPITLEKISKISKYSLNCNLEFIKSILSYDKDSQVELLRILSRIDSKH